MLGIIRDREAMLFADGPEVLKLVGDVLADVHPPGYQHAPEPGRVVDGQAGPRIAAEYRYFARVRVVET